jgi:hypothetical protein
MHAFIFLTEDSCEFSERKAPDILHIRPDPGIGIDHIRDITRFLTRKPLSLPANIVVVHQAETMSLPAQNAFLKTLEDPPGNSQIYLITSQPDSLLPTILSRVQIINSPHKSYSFDPSHSSDLFNQLLSSGVGDRLKLIDSQSFTRETFGQFLSDLEVFLHQNIFSPQTGHIYNLITKTRKYLSSNCNLRLVLDFFTLNLPTN